MPKNPRPSLNNTFRQEPYRPEAKLRNMAPVSGAETSLPASASGGRHNSSKTWGPEEDKTLLRVRQENLNWNLIAEKYFPNKTGNACRKRHERLVIKNNTTNDWDSAKVEALARSYMEFREGMWKILAQELGEKWETVEKKCMEKGLKNLKSHGRAAHRRHRSNNQEDDDDDEMDNNRFIDSGLGPDANLGDETASKDHPDLCSRSGQHDQQQLYLYGGVSAAPSVYSREFSAGRRSSVQTPSRTSSTSYPLTPQQRQLSLTESLPGTLPGIATILDIDKCSRGTRY